VPAPDDQTVYAIYYPASTSISSPPEQPSCTGFGAYHGNTLMPSGQAVMYAVIPSCDGYLGMSGIDFITASTSHEVIESVTDPTGTGFNWVNWAASPIASAAEGWPGAEVADLCEFQPRVMERDPSVGFLVQRTWSNKAAAAWHDPCVPVPAGSGPYFNTQAMVRGGTQPMPFSYTQGISLAPGHSITIPVRLYADAPIGAWQLSAAEELNPHLKPDTYNELSFSWDVASGAAGDVRHLTIRRTAPPSGATAVFLRVGIVSTSGTTQNVSWLIVGQD
jgi:hypothetical protein